MLISPAPVFPAPKEGSCPRLGQARVAGSARAGLGEKGSAQAPWNRQMEMCSAGGPPSLDLQSPDTKTGMIVLSAQVAEANEVEK